MHDTKKSISFSKQVRSNSTETLTHTVQRDATIEEVQVRIYRGAENDLEVQPYVLRGQSDAQNRIDLIEFEGKTYLDGDDDIWTFSISEEVEEDDEIKVEATNNDGSNAYDYRCNVELDEAGGVHRFIGLVQDIGGGS
jgi:hypothetical protein